MLPEDMKICFFFNADSRWYISYSKKLTFFFQFDDDLFCCCSVCFKIVLLIYRFGSTSYSDRRFDPILWRMILSLVPIYVWSWGPKIWTYSKNVPSIYRLVLYFGFKNIHSFGKLTNNCPPKKNILELFFERKKIQNMLIEAKFMQILLSMVTYGTFKKEWIFAQCNKIQLT